MIRLRVLCALDDFLHRFGISFDRLCAAVDAQYLEVDEPLGLFLEARYDDDDPWCA